MTTFPSDDHEDFPTGMLPPVPEVYPTDIRKNRPAPYLDHPTPPNLGIQAIPLLRWGGQDLTDIDLGPRALRLPLEGEWAKVRLDEDADIEVVDKAGIAHHGLAPEGSTVYFRITAVLAARWEPNAHTSGSWAFLASINSKLLWITQLDGPDANAQFIWQVYNELPAPPRPAR